MLIIIIIWAFRSCSILEIREIQTINKCSWIRILNVMYFSFKYFVVSKQSMTADSKWISKTNIRDWNWSLHVLKIVIHSRLVEIKTWEMCLCLWPKVVPRTNSHIPQGLYCKDRNSFAICFRLTIFDWQICSRFWW